MSSFPLTDSSAAIFPVVEVPQKKIDWKAGFLQVCLQLSHRLGAVALLCMLTTWAMLYLTKDAHIALAVAAGTAEGGLAFALIARLMSAKNPLARREANGVAIFNLVLFILAIHLMLFTRLDVIRNAAGQFFSPTTPPQAENHW